MLGQRRRRSPNIKWTWYLSFLYIVETGLIVKDLIVCFISKWEYGFLCECLNNSDEILQYPMLSSYPTPENIIYLKYFKIWYKEIIKITSNI